MRWHDSLITKITIMFALALIGSGAVIFTLHGHKRATELKNTKNLAIAILRSNNDLKNLEKEGFTPIINKEITKIGWGFFHNGKNEHVKVKPFIYKRSIYIVLKNGMVFKSPNETERFPRVLLPISIILLIVFLYIATIRNILPIYNLKKKVKEFADGNYDIDCRSSKKDEVAMLSNEFDKSVKKIKKLRDSRQLFLRNIMHELKTPITKGKLSCEMIEESNYQEILKNVFRRQETLLEEFSRIEKLSANELNLNTKTYTLQDIVDFSLDILNHDVKSVTCSLQPMSLHVDFELFGTALKNLLDNGISHSDDKSVLIESTEKQIIISNSGKELEFPLENYTEPYFLDAKKAKSSRGLGFGLFITLHIIRLHQMKIVYNREKNRNVFTIYVKKS